MNKLIFAMAVGMLLAGCGQQQGQEKSTSSAQGDELLRKAYQGKCTKVPTLEEIQRGEKCK